MSNGLNDYAGNPEMRAQLREPFPPKLISHLDKGSHSEDYVNHAAVTDRLNIEAPGWTTSKPEFIKDSEGHIFGVLCSMTIGSVTRWEIGDVDRPSHPGAEAKLAMSDFIKRAAMRFGVGLDLWSKEDLQWTSPESHRRLPGDGLDEPSAIAAAPDRAVVQPDSTEVVEATTVAGPVVDEALGRGIDTPGEGAESTAGPASNGNEATPEQWARLLQVVGGSKVKALKRINDSNGPGTNYALSTVNSATKEEVALAISGGAS